jgi:hypothetical protein
MNAKGIEKHICVTAVAVVTAMAVFLAPFCASMCGLRSACGSAMVMAERDGGDCHHEAVSRDDAMAGSVMLVATSACRGAELPLMTVVRDDDDPILMARSSPQVVSGSNVVTQRFSRSIVWDRAPHGGGDDLGLKNLPARALVLRI